MKRSIAPSEIESFMVGHLTEVFDTMLTLKATPITGLDPSHFAERVSGSVGFAGENVTGAVYLHLSAPFALQAAATMLGLKPEELGSDADVNDVIGEVTNMLAGGLKSWLCDAGATCALTTPAVIRGTSFSVVPSPDVKAVPVGFDCGLHRGMLEVHIKFR